MFKALAIGFSASLLACSSAHAATFNLGTLPNGVPIVTSDTLTASNKTDVIKFALAGANGLAGSLRNFIVSVSLPHSTLTYDFATLSAVFTNSSNAVVGSLNLLAPDKNFMLTTGTYKATVTGTYTPGSAGGIYGLTLLAGNAAPAPGPDGWLIMGAGLGALALLKRRALPAGRKSAAV